MIMMPELPPGIVYLGKRLPRIAGPPIITYLSGLLTQSRLDVDIPDWLLWTAVSLSYPAYFVLQVQWQLWNDQREAARHGAVIAPYIPALWPGGLGLILSAGKQARLGYPGMSF